MKQYNFPDVLKGDTFKSRDITIKNDTTQTPIDLSGCLIDCEFRKTTKTGIIVKTISVGSGVVLTNAVNGIFTIDSFLANWDAGIYYYDFQFTFPNGKIITYFGGYLKLIQDVTQK